MKFLRTLLIIIVILAVIIVILTFVAPTKMSVTRSEVINAPREVVFNNISSFNNLHKWYPWDRKDPNMKYSIDGTDGTVGATWKWEGNDQVGQGEETFAKIDAGKEVDMDIHFIKPMNSKADGNLMLADTTGGTKVTWTFSGDMPRPWNIMTLFMNMDASLGKDFDAGLNNLKELSEKDAMNNMNKTYRGYKINVMDMPSKTYVGKRASVDFKDMGKFFADNLPKIGADVQKAKLETIGAPSGIFYTYDTVKMKTDMAAAFPVKEVPSSFKGWQTISAPAGKALEIDYYGDYAKSKTAYMALDDYQNEKGLKSKSFVIEEYITDPMVVKDTAKWLTKIYYYVE